MSFGKPRLIWIDNTDTNRKELSWDVRGIYLAHDTYRKLELV
jgi:hypothetical protein